MMRITVNGVRVDASVKKTILPEFWSVAKGKALEKKREYKELNLYLDSIRLRIMKIQRELEIEEVSVSANSVLDRFQGKDAPVQRTLFEVFREHNDKCAQLSGTDMAPATVQRYETSLKHTQDFVWETYHKKDILLDEVSRQFIEDYEFWLKTERYYHLAQIKRLCIETDEWLRRRISMCIWKSWKPPRPEYQT